MTETATQVELLNGVYVLGMFTDSNPYFEEFAEQYEQELQLAQLVVGGKANLTSEGEIFINDLWEILLSDYLKLKDSVFKDLNDLVVAIFEGGNFRESFLV